MTMAFFNHIPIGVPIYMSVSFEISDIGEEYRNNIAIRVISIDVSTGTLTAVMLGIMDEVSSCILMWDGIQEEDRSGREYEQVLMSTDVISYHVIECDEIPLMVNWYFLSDSLKGEFFGVGV